MNGAHPHTGHQDFGEPVSSSPRPRSVARRLIGAFAALGVALLAINALGLTLSLRSTEITASYADFARPATFTFDDAMARLQRLDPSDRKGYVTEALRIFHYGMAHIPQRAIKTNGLDHYRMRVPVWENYILYLLSFLKPDTYMDYEFCSYRKALERGTGRCGQQSLAVVGFLSENGIKTGFAHLGGHTVATAEVSDNEWYLLDPDYGGVVPFGLEQAELNPASVVPYYWNDAIVRRNMFNSYGPDGNKTKYGGPEVRWKRACPIEQIAYVLKWSLPFLLLLPWAMRNVRRRLSSQASG